MKLNITLADCDTQHNIKHRIVLDVVVLRVAFELIMLSAAAPNQALVTELSTAFKRHHDTQHNNSQHNNTQNNNTYHNAIQHKGLICDTEHEGS
jgi:hypothetical protein